MKKTLLILLVTASAHASIQYSNTNSANYFIGNGGGLTGLNYNNITNSPAIPTTNNFVTASITNSLATTNYVDTSVLNGTNNVLIVATNAANLVGVLPQYPKVQVATNAPFTNAVLISPDGTNRVWSAATNLFDAAGAGTLSASNALVVATNSFYGIGNSNFYVTAAVTNGLATTNYVDTSVLNGTNNVLIVATNAANLVGVLPQYPKVQVATNAPFINAVLISPDGTNRVWSQNYSYTITNFFADITITTNSSYWSNTNLYGSFVIPANTLNQNGQSIVEEEHFSGNYAGTSGITPTNAAWFGATNYNTTSAGNVTIPTAGGSYFYTRTITRTSPTAARATTRIVQGGTTVSASFSEQFIDITNLDFTVTNTWRVSVWLPVGAGNTTMTFKWAKIKFVP